MAKSQIEPMNEATPIKVLKQCSCGATFFRAAVPIGEIVNGEFVARSYEYECAHCHKGQTIDQMIERTINPVVI